VRVEVPTRVRVDPAALTDRRADLEEALGAAAERALATSRDVVLEPRSSYARPRLNAPEFTWLGTGLEDVPVALRTEVEACLTDAFWRAAGRAGVVDATDARPAMRERVEETVDDTRYDRLLALYEIPSYDGSDKRHAKVGGDAQRVRRKPRPPETEIAYLWRRLADDDVGEAYQIAMDIDDLRPPAAGHMGVMYADLDGALNIAIFQYPDRRRVFWDTIPDKLTSYRYDVDGDTWIESTSSLSPRSGYEISWLADKGPGAEAPLTQYIGEDVEAAVWSAVAHRPGSGVSRAEIKASIDLRAKNLVAAEMQRMDAVSWAKLRVGGGTVLVAVPYQFPRDIHSATLLPLSEVVEVPKPEKPETGAAGAGTGAGKGGGVTEGGPTAAAAGGAGAGKGAAPRDPSPVGLKSPIPGEPGFLPPSVALHTGELTCAPYRDEPSLKELGSLGLELEQQMTRISHLLGVPPCEYIGNFLLNAADALGSRAVEIEEFDPGEATIRSTPDGHGNLGRVDFVPRASPQIMMMRRLAAVVPLIHILDGWMQATYEWNPNLIGGTWAGEPIGWELRHNGDLIESMNHAVGSIFARTCQVLMLQLLKASREEIEKRQSARNPHYAEDFERVILPQLAPLTELLRAREILKNAAILDFEAKTPRGVGSPPPIFTQRFKDVRIVDAPPKDTRPQPQVQTWDEAWRGFTQSLKPKQAPPPAASRAETYELVRQNGSFRVRDLDGRLWSEDELEMHITLRRGVLETADPLIKQFTDMPEVVGRLKAAQAYARMFQAGGVKAEGVGVKAEVEKLLAEMHEANEKVTGDVKSHAMTAFKMTEIVEGYGGEVRIPGTDYELQGIHRMTHEQVGEFFGGAPYYALGVSWLFDSVYKRKKQLQFAMSLDIMALSVICPPLGAALGYGVAKYEEHEAEKREYAWKAFIDPDEVMNWAAIEAELFAARLSKWFAVVAVGIEFGGLLVKAFGRGAVAAEEAVLTARGATAAGEAAEATAQLARLAERSFAERFAFGMLQQWAAGEVIGWIVGPLVDAVAQNAAEAAPVGGIERALERVVEQMAERRLAEAASETEQ
jgi:hypothetical protein